MILANALGSQPVVECKGISGVRGQNALLPRLQICAARKADVGGKGSNTSCLVLLLFVVVMEEEEKSGNIRRFGGS